MDFSEYATIQAVNWSTLKEVRRSPLRYHYRTKAPMEDSDSFRLGRAAHTAILEPDRMQLDYAVWTGDRRAGKAWDEFCATHSGQTIIRAGEYTDCLCMGAAVRSHPVAGPLLTTGKAETVLQWTDELTGLACKARLDWIGSCLVDVKTTSNIDARIFGALAGRMGYHCQLAFYRMGLRANGIECDAAKIVAVESSAPYDVAVFGLSDADLEAGEVEVMDLLAKVSAGRFSGQWPGRYPGEQPLALPAWMFNEDDGEGLGLIVGEDAA